MEYVITPEMVNNNSGMTAGTYALRGGASSYYDDNKITMLNSFGSNNCAQEYVNGQYREIQCGVAGITAYAFVGGTFVLVGDHYQCDANSDGSSYCNYNGY